eukprot:1896688-Prymnesium_polylepis.1
MELPALPKRSLAHGREHAAQAVCGERQRARPPEQTPAAPRPLHAAPHRHRSDRVPRQPAAVFVPQLAKRAAHRSAPSGARSPAHPPGSVGHNGHLLQPVRTRPRQHAAAQPERTRSVAPRREARHRVTRSSFDSCTPPVLCALRSADASSKAAVSSPHSSSLCTRSRSRLRRALVASSRAARRPRISASDSCSIARSAEPSARVAAHSSCRPACVRSASAFSAALSA